MTCRLPHLGLLIAAVAAAAVFTNCAAAQSGVKVENPLYQRWAKFKPGVSARIETVTENATKRIEQTTIYKLIEVTDSKVVVDITNEIRQEGRKDEGTPQTFTHQRWFTLPPGMKKETLTKPANVIEEGAEKVKIGDKEYDAKWYRSKVRVEAGETFIKEWYSDAVPGGLIKEENETPAAKSKTKRELVEVKE
jgi:hypothetical protein